MGDIIPNQESFIFNKRKVGEHYKPVELSNVTKKVHTTILAVLDMYFACKCDEFTRQQTYEIDKLGMIMEAHLDILWNLKQAIMYEDPRGTKMRKPHGTCHIGEFIGRFGPCIYADTDSFESSHKKYTTAVWRGTSKRLSTLVKEMTTASIIQNCVGHLNFYTSLQSENGISKCLKTFGPKPGKDGLVINAFGHVSDIRFIATSDLETDGITNILKGIGPNIHLYNQTIFGHCSLPSSRHLSKYLKTFFTNIDNFSNKVWPAMTNENNIVEFSVVRGISYEGSKESGVGKGVIYATANNADKGPRYDFITVQTNYIDEITGQNVENYDVAQVLMIIQAHVYEYNNENKRVLKNENNWYLIVQYMQKAVLKLYNKPHTIQHRTIKQLVWEERRGINLTNNRHSFYIDMISIDNLAGSAMVIPYFSFHTATKTRQGKN